MIEGHVWLEKIKSIEQFQELCEKAKHDSHGVYLPTHVIKKDGELVGYFSIGAPGVPIVLAWLSTEHLKNRDSFQLINMVENHVHLNGATHVAFPVPKSSPFHPIMESLGFKNTGEYTFFVKEL